MICKDCKDAPGKLCALHRFASNNHDDASDVELQTIGARLQRVEDLLFQLVNGPASPVSPAAILKALEEARLEERDAATKRAEEAEANTRGAALELSRVSRELGLTQVRAEAAEARVRELETVQSALERLCNETRAERDTLRAQLRTAREALRLEQEFQERCVDMELTALADLKNRKDAARLAALSETAPAPVRSMAECMLSHHVSEAGSCPHCQARKAPDATKEETT